MTPKLIAVSVLFVCSSGLAYAGEVTGNGKTIEVKGKSVCAFSGLEDDAVNGGPGVVQTFGRHPVPGIGVSDNRDNIPNHPGPAAPGVACNPSEPS